MVLQVKEKTWLDNQEIQGEIFFDMGCPEETVYWTLEYILSSVTVGRSDFDIEFTVYYRFEKSKYLLHNRIKWNPKFSSQSYIKMVWKLQDYL